MKVELEDRLSHGDDLRKQGYNCAQSVAMVFDDVVGLSAETIAKLTSALGSGVAGTGEICGAANAMAIVEGMRHGADAASKKESAAAARRLVERFAYENDGKLRCVDLKGKPGCRTCNQLVGQCIRILHESLD